MTPECWIEEAEFHAAEAGSIEPAAVIAVLASWLTVAARGYCPGYDRAPPVGLPTLRRSQRDRREETEPIA
jgi:hypothetical protein